MQFTAKIKRTSAVWRNWTSLRRISATLGNVPFHKVPNGDFVSGVLTPDQVVELQHHIAVVLEATGMPLPLLKAPEKPPAPVVQQVPEKSQAQPEPRQDYRARREARLKGR